jgi:hypothetical protein
MAENGDRASIYAYVMATYPHEPTKLSDNEKKAYRYLLYMAMLHIRNLCQSRCKASLNPLDWRKQYLRSRGAGGLADWLHNLAQHAAKDMDNFDTDWFWKEYNRFLRDYPKYAINYREIYETQLSKLNKMTNLSVPFYDYANCTDDFIIPVPLLGSFQE